MKYLEALNIVAKDRFRMSGRKEYILTLPHVHKEHITSALMEFWNGINKEPDNTLLNQTYRFMGATFHLEYTGIISDVDRDYLEAFAIVNS